MMEPSRCVPVFLVLETKHAAARSVRLACVFQDHDKLLVREGFLETLQESDIRLIDPASMRRLTA